MNLFETKRRKVGTSYLARRLNPHCRTSVWGKTPGHCEMDQSRARDGSCNKVGIPTFLPCVGLPPCERPPRTSRGERNRAGVYGEAR